MGLPPRSYFRLAEIMERWGASPEDIASYVHDDLLELSILVTAARAESGSINYSDDPPTLEPESERVLYGLQQVYNCDVVQVFHVGCGYIERFKPEHSNGYLELVEGVDRLLVNVKDFMVTRAERDRFEAANNIAIEEEVGRTPPLFDVMRSDYSEVVMNAEVFRLGRIQAAVVHQLHQAARTANPWRSGKQLLGAANANTTRLVDLFKNKQNWRALIASDGRGSYRLNVPEVSGARQPQRAFRRSRFVKAARS